MTNDTTILRNTRMFSVYNNNCMDNEKKNVKVKTYLPIYINYIINYVPSCTVPIYARKSLLRNLLL